MSASGRFDLAGGLAARFWVVLTCSGWNESCVSGNLCTEAELRHVRLRAAGGARRHVPVATKSPVKG